MATRLSSGGVLIPSSIGTGIQQGVLNFINVRNARRAAETEKEFQDRRLKLEEERTDVQAQNVAFERFLKLAPFASPGTSIAENPFLIPTARAAFGDLDDPQFESLGNMILTPETLETILSDREIKAISELEADDPKLERIVNQRLIGKAVTNQELELEGQRASVLSSALDLFTTDEETLGDIARASFGLEPTATIPGIVDETGAPVVFQSEGIARIWAGLQDLTFQQKKLSADSQKDLAGELISQAAQVDITLGRPKASQIVQAYEASVLGTFAEGQAPIEKLFTSSTPEVQRAISIFAGAVRVGESNFEEFLRGTPGGSQILTVLGLGQTLGEFLPREEVQAAMKSILPQLEGVGISIASPGFFSVKDRFIFEPAEAGADPDARLPAGGAVEPSGLPPETDPNVVAMANLIQRGIPVETAIADASIIIGPEAAQAAADAAIALAAQAAGGPAVEGVDRVTPQDQATVDELSEAFIEAVTLRNTLDQEALRFFGGDVTGSASFAKKREANMAATNAREILERIRAINPAMAQQLEEQISR